MINNLFRPELNDHWTLIKCDFNSTALRAIKLMSSRDWALLEYKISMLSSKHFILLKFKDWMRLVEVAVV